MAKTRLIISQDIAEHVTKCRPLIYLVLTELFLNWLLRRECLTLPTQTPTCTYCSPWRFNNQTVVYTPWEGDVHLLFTAMYQESLGLKSVESSNQCVRVRITTHNVGITTCSVRITPVSLFLHHNKVPTRCRSTRLLLSQLRIVVELCDYNTSKFDSLYYYYWFVSWAHMVNIHVCFVTRWCYCLWWQNKHGWKPQEPMICVALC